MGLASFRRCVAGRPLGGLPRRPSAGGALGLRIAEVASIGRAAEVFCSMTGEGWHRLPHRLVQDATRQPAITGFAPRDWPLVYPSFQGILDPPSLDFRFRDQLE